MYSFGIFNTVLAFVGLIFILRIVRVVGAWPRHPHTRYSRFWDMHYWLLPSGFTGIRDHVEDLFQIHPWLHPWYNRTNLGKRILGRIVTILPIYPAVRFGLWILSLLEALIFWFLAAVIALIIGLIVLIGELIGRGFYRAVVAQWQLEPLRKETQELKKKTETLQWMVDGYEEKIRQLEREKRYLGVIQGDFFSIDHLDPHWAAHLIYDLFLDNTVLTPEERILLLEFVTGLDSEVKQLILERIADGSARRSEIILLRQSCLQEGELAPT